MIDDDLVECRIRPADVAVVQRVLPQDEDDVRWRTEPFDLGYSLGIAIEYSLRSQLWRYGFRFTAVRTLGDGTIVPNYETLDLIRAAPAREVFFAGVGNNAVRLLMRWLEVKRGEAH